MEANMFKKMRKDEKQLVDDKAFKILKDNEYGILTTVGPNRYPYGVPINYVIMDKKIYLHSALKGHKIDNIKHNKKVSFTVVDSYKLKPKKFTADYKSVIAFGCVGFVKGELKKKALQQFIYKFSPDFKNKGFHYIDSDIDKTKIIEITIEDIKAKQNS